MEPTIEDRNLKYIKGIENDEAIPQDIGNVSEIDCGIVEYVRERMHCRTVTREVRCQALAFQRDMDRMSGW